MTRTELEGYALSPPQRRLWQVLESGRLCWAQALIEVPTAAGAQELAAALRTVVAEHEVFDTTYHRPPGIRTPLQVPDSLAGIEWTEQDGDPEEHAHIERTRPFDLAHGPMVRAALFPAAHSLVLTVCPLAADLATMRLLARWTLDRLAGRPSPDRLPYLQFVEWQRSAAEERDPVDIVHADRAPARFALPTSAATGRLTGPCPDVAAYADSRGAPATAVLLAAWHVLLHRWAGHRGADLTVGTAFPGRKYEEMLGCAGPITIWAATTTALTGTETFDQLVGRIEAQMTAVEDVEEHIPYTEHGGWVAAFEHAPDDPVPGLGWAEVDAEPYELKLTCDNERLIWDSTRFDTTTLGRLDAQYRALVIELTANGADPVRCASGLDARARAALVGPLAHGAAPAPHGAGRGVVHGMVEQQVLRTPDAPAVCEPGRSVTYAELDAQANRVARWLRGRGVGPGACVAVCLPHGINLLTTLLGVLKAGGAYVPLDPQLPQLRRDRLVRATRCVVSLDAGSMPSDLPSFPDGDVLAWADPGDVAYVMFTSGSTGEPKGVAVPHGAVVNYLKWAATEYTGDGGDGSVLHSSAGFDLTVTSLWLPLITGRTVHVDAEWRDPLELAKGLTSRSGFDFVKVTPSHLEVLNQTSEPDRRSGTTRALVVGGEPLPYETIRSWLPHTRVINEYGPTEATVGCTAYTVPPDLGHGPVPIGGPIAGTDVYVLDEEMRPVPVAVSGELYVGGAGLALGYLDAAARTAESFVPHPYSSTPGARLYRTGDLVCRNPRGELIHLGRTDEQVKVRGVRVEPEEIRAAVREHPAVADAAVVVRGERIVAHLVANQVPPPTDRELRAFLAARLPDWLAPDGFSWLDRIPLTANAKVDREALETAPPPRSTSSDLRDVTELVIVRVIEDLLGTAGVSAEDDFFALGGHSLLAVRLVARVSAALDCSLPVSALYDGARTARALAHVLRDGRAIAPRALVPLSGGDSGAPLICVHPAGGDVLGYGDLASAVAGPVYGVQSITDEPEQSITELARSYLPAICAASNGPQRLVGWSMGGVIAFELARLLADSGQEVAGLLLIDSHLVPASTDPDLAPLRWLAVRLAELTGAEIEDADQIAQHREFGQTVAYLVDRAAGLTDQERHELSRRTHLHRAHAAAAGRFAARPCDVPVTLVQSEAVDVARRRTVAESWRAQCLGSFQDETLAGDHFTLLRYPLVRELARFVPPDSAV